MNPKNPPAVSVVMPVYNVERFVVQAVLSVLDQSFQDFELIIVDDGSRDHSIALCETWADHRTRIVHQVNAGLAAARNTGIAAARGEFVALLDSDDAWTQDKLARHVEALRANPTAGAAYAGSVLIDEGSRSIGIEQRPRLGAVTARQVFCCQVIQNGSSPVFRKAALEEAALRPAGTDRVWYFDETLRRSEDVECWTRIALTTKWGFVGIPGAFTLYRVNQGGLSADVIRQLESWERAVEKITAYAPDFIAEHEPEARARELRYLARRCFQIRDRGLGFGFATASLRAWPQLVLREPVKTLTTLIACGLLRLLPDAPFNTLARAVGAPMA